MGVYDVSLVQDKLFKNVITNLFAHCIQQKRMRFIIFLSAVKNQNNIKKSDVPCMDLNVLSSIQILYSFYMSN